MMLLGYECNEKGINSSDRFCLVGCAGMKLPEYSQVKASPIIQIAVPLPWMFIKMMDTANCENHYP